MNRNRAAYFRAYHAARREARNAARRRQYVPTGRPPGRPLGTGRPLATGLRATKAATDRYRALRWELLEARYLAAAAVELSAARLSDELNRLIAEQERDARHYTVRGTARFPIGFERLNIDDFGDRAA